MEALAAARVDRTDYEVDAQSHLDGYSIQRLQEVALGSVVRVELASPIEDQVARLHLHSGSAEDEHPVVEVPVETRHHWHDFL